MGNVIGFEAYLADISHRHARTNADWLDGSTFTARDRAELNSWATNGRRVEQCHCDMGQFAMLYQDGQPWASWGVVRQGEHVLLWNCVSYVDVGRFSTMVAALSTLADATEQLSLGTVVHLIGVGGRCLPMGVGPAL